MSPQLEEIFQASPFYEPADDSEISLRRRTLTSDGATAGPIMKLQPHERWHAASASRSTSDIRQGPVQVAPTGDTRNWAPFSKASAKEFHYSFGLHLPFREIHLKLLFHNTLVLFHSLPPTPEIEPIASYLLNVQLRDSRHILQFDELLARMYADVSKKWTLRCAELEDEFARHWERVYRDVGSPLVTFPARATDPCDKSLASTAAELEQNYSKGVREYSQILRLLWHSWDFRQPGIQREFRSLRNFAQVRIRRIHGPAEPRALSAPSKAVSFVCILLTATTGN
jgi:hypothetical protein